MKRWLVFMLAWVIVSFLHEGMHAVTAAAFDEYKAFHVRPYGLEVEYRTPVNERTGAKWAVVSGSSNLATIMLGYALLIPARRVAAGRSLLFKGGIYYLTLLSLLLDPLNLSVGPFLYGGDANGIAVGLGINRYIIQALFLLILLANRELVAQTLLPTYGVGTKSVLLRPWLPQRI